MRNSNVFTQGEIRRALDFDETYDDTEVLVPGEHDVLERYTFTR